MQFLIKVLSKTVFVCVWVGGWVGVCVCVLVCNIDPTGCHFGLVFIYLLAAR